ncbi:MAG: phosphoglycerate kinase, partial [Pseudomonadota bacterium]
MGWKRLDDMDLAGKTVLIRVDANVPMQDGMVSDRTRLTKMKPTIDDVIAMGGRPVLISHFGRPADAPDQNFSLIQVVSALEEEIGRKVEFATDCFGPVAQSAVDAQGEGAVLLLENTRFHKGEKKNDADFVAALAALGDVFVSDAFSASHRAHASVAGLAEALPACAGRLMEAELHALEAALGTPKKPVLAVVGGAKVSTKLELLNNLIDLMDAIVIGGGMANTFLAAQGHPVGKSLCEHDLIPTAKDIMAKAAAQNCELILPVDIVVAKEFAANAEHAVYPADACPDDGMILDAGPASIA